MGFDPKQIEAKMSGFIKTLRGKGSFNRSDDAIPPFSAAYVQATKEALEIRVHADGVWPADLISKKAPSETKEEFEYREDTYQAVTMAPWDKIVASTSAIWHNAPVEVDDDDAALYIGVGYPKYDTLPGWFAEVLRPVKASDPSAVVVVTAEVPMIETEEGIIVDDTQELNPFGQLYRTENVIEYVMGSHFVGLSIERSKVSGNEGGGFIFVFVDDDAEYRYTQVGEFAQYRFELTEHIVYPESWDHMPAYQLGGLPTVTQNEVYQRSVFYNSIPYLNTAAIQNSNQDAVIFRCAFPTRVYYQEDCGECEGRGEIDGDACGTCKGTGQRRGFSPQSDYVHVPPGKFDPENTIPFPGLAYVSPDPGVMTFLEEYVSSKIEQAGMAVNIDITKKSGEPVTATEKRIDLQAHQRMLIDFEKSAKGLAESVTQDIVDFRYIDRDVEVVVTRKSEFSIRGSDELLVEVEENAKAGMPQFVRAQHIREQVNIRFGGNLKMKRVMDLQIVADGLLGLMAQEILPGIGRTIDPWRVTLHDQFGAIVAEAQAADSNLLDKEDSDIRPILEAIAQARTPQDNSAAAILGV